MSRYCRYSVVLLSLTVTACGGRSSGSVSPADPYQDIAVSQISLVPLSGANVLLLRVGQLIAADSTQPQIRTSLPLSDLVNAAIDSALRRDGRDVQWFGLEEQRRAARRNPTLNLNPELMGTAYLADNRVASIPDPLWTQVRTLAALTNARYLIAPASVRIAGSDGARTASYILVLADARSGNVLARVRSNGGPLPTVEAALAQAASSLVAPSRP